MKTTPAQMRDKIRLALARLRDAEASFNQDTSGNPQVLELKHRTQGEINAYLACLDALNGQQCLLNCAARGII